jgi:general secretion pathway protein M
MISISSIKHYFAHYSSLSGLSYVVLVIILCLTTLFTLGDIIELYKARHIAVETISKLNARAHLLPGDQNGTNSRMEGSPFLQGKTGTIASAELLQRITSLVASAGGRVVSSEIEQRGAQAKDGYVTAVTNFEVEQDALQRVLYDTETGAPFLFVDQLVVQTPTLLGERGRLRVVLGVAAMWPGEK